MIKSEGSKVRSRRRLLTSLFARAAVTVVALVVAGGPGISASADEASCKAYADDAVATVANQARLGCNFGGRRWSSDWNTHFNVCMDWSNDARNGGMNAMNEYATRASDLAKCAAEKSGVPIVFSAWAPFKGDDPPTLDSFCRAYAYVAERQTAGAVRECGYTGRRWEATFDVHREVCVNAGGGAGALMAGETYQRTIDKVACAVRVRDAAKPTEEAPPPVEDNGGKTAKVIKDVDVYDAPGGGGNKIGSLNSGTQVGFAGCENDWCHVTGDGVPNGDGYVYNGADYRSLKF